MKNPTMKNCTMKKLNTKTDLTEGSIAKGILLFSLPLMAGNLLQQLYNIVDTIVVGKYVGSVALAAVGSAYTLMTLLTSILLGLCMGSSVVFSQLYGSGQPQKVREAVANAFVLVGATAVGMTALVYLGLPSIIKWMNIPAEAVADIRDYLMVVFAGISFTFLYHFMAAALRSIGNSTTPLLFLLGSTVLNIGLDLLLVAVIPMGCFGAALATVIAQGAAALGIFVYVLLRGQEICPKREECRLQRGMLTRLAKVAVLSSVQQSIMNTGILMVQSLVNSFGVTAMAAFAAGVKIDSFGYSPAQDFANGFATFVSQNDGAGKKERVQKGIRTALGISILFCIIISIVVNLFAEPLLSLFIDRSNRRIMEIGVRYLHIEGSFYAGIGILFLFYAIFRGLEKPGISIVLTVVSLGLRVLLAYLFAPVWGLDAVWMAVPAGWILADLTGIFFLHKYTLNEKARNACC